MGVYIIINKTKSTKDKLIIKVGCSKDVETRFKQIQRSFRFNGMNDELMIFTKMPCSKYKLLEKHIHTMLNSRRILDNHEWFAVEEEFLNERLMRIDLSYYK